MTGSRIACPCCSGRGYTLGGGYSLPGDSYPEDCAPCDGRGYFALPLNAAEALADVSRWNQLTDFYNVENVPDLG